MPKYPLQGEYPAVPGNKPVSIADVAGSSSYTVVTVATPPTGGQIINASAFGLQYLEYVWASMGSDDGQYVGVCYLNPYYNGVPSTSVILQWVTAATGAEVAATTDLSARTIRLFAIGR